MFNMSFSSLLLIGSLLSSQVLAIGGRDYAAFRAQKLKMLNKRGGNEPWAANDTFTHGPVISESFADPSIIKVDDTWYAFATSHIDVHIQVATSTDFATWTKLEGHDALPVVPGWVNQKAPNTWAPDVNVLDDGTFLMYYSATTIDSVGKGHHCVGGATSKNILGPYSPINTTLTCPYAQGGSIDAAGFKDFEELGSGWGYDDDEEVQNFGGDCWTQPEWWGGGKGGQRYIVYKIDGNSIGHGGACGNTVQPIVSTPIVLTKVQADGVTTEGESITIFDNAGASDQGITEAPSLVKSRKGKYFLFFSTGCFSGSNYTQWFATADKIEGPYTRAPAPMYTTGDIVDGKALLSPGGGSIYWDAHHFVFHADNPTQGNRGMWDALVDLIGDSVDTGLQTNRTISKKRSVAY